MRTINHKVRSRHGKYVPTCTRMVNITPVITLRSRRHWAILCHGGGGGGGGGGGLRLLLCPRELQRLFSGTLCGVLLSFVQWVLLILAV